MKWEELKGSSFLYIWPHRSLFLDGICQDVYNEENMILRSWVSNALLPCSSKRVLEDEI